MSADLLRNSLIYMGQSPVAKNVVTRTPLRGMARRFVPGEGVDDVLAAAHEANRIGLTVTANYLGEAVRSEEGARRAADVYIALLERIHAEALRANISLKFTQLGQEIGEGFLRENLGRVLETARETGIFIRFDMESSDFTQRTLDAFEALWSEGWREIGVVLQAYLHRSFGDVHRMNELGARVRLCKGAYAEPAEVAFQGREKVGESFVQLMRVLLAEGTYPGIATHDEAMIDATVEFATREGIGPERFEFQMLHGVRRDLQSQLARDGWNVRAYIPFGEAWYPYLMRRLAERPANVLFMAGSIVRESPLGFLWPKRK
ncbi:MAG: proline dehydrogenase family protein [Longimicrobiales bacterium]|nr:proline dehydrogenase family protein [Longimicrobiales bacterium]